MNPSMHPAIQHLFQVSTIESVSREQLETFVEEYPCFGFGHYLLSRKLRAENAEQFLAATQKTSLYFSNPFWLQWMLENAPEPAGKPIPAPVSFVEEQIPAPLSFVEEQIPAPAPDSHSWEQTPGPTPVESPEEPIQDVEPPFVLDEQDHPAEPTPILAVVPAEAWPEMENPEVPAEANTLHADPEAPTSAAELLLESIEQARVLRESLQKINEDYQPAPAPASEPAYAEPPSPPVITDNAPLFEPLHTIDYFASQGIRLTLDENPTDPLGRQLKSFTEWLRTMRRLPQKDRQIVPDRVAEQTIQNFAAHSIEGKEPVTETMAEVLAKQGMPERARIVYEKLSLLNPDKSAYFAAKIEQLNIH
jgi:hypothetical protein